MRAIDKVDWHLTHAHPRAVQDLYALDEKRVTTGSEVSCNEHVQGSAVERAKGGGVLRQARGKHDSRQAIGPSA